MPSEKKNAEEQVVDTSAKKKKASASVGKSAVRRIRTAQPTTEGGEDAAIAAESATKPRTRTSSAKKSAPNAQPMESEEQILAEKQTVEEAPVAQAPALAAPQTPLPVPSEDITAVQRSMPPIYIPALRGERRMFWGRVLLLFLVGALLALSVLIFVYRPTRYSAYSHSIVFLYHADSDTTQVLYDGKSCEEGIVGQCTQSERDSSGSVCAALIGGTLYLVQGDEVMLLSDSVLDFALAQNGRAVAYRTADQALYYTQVGSKADRSTVSLDTRDARYCLSPNGELLFYTYAQESGEGEIKTRADVFSLSGDKPFLANTTHMIPVAIADDYEHIFYFNDNGDLYYINDDAEVSLCRRKGEGEMELLFDREFDELLIKDEGGVTLWQDGELTVISQLKGAENLTLLANKLAVSRTLPCATQCLVRSFDENYYLKKGTDAQGVELVYVKGDELRSVAFVDEKESGIVVTDKGVYYLERAVSADEVRKHLYRCPIGQTEPVRLSWDVEDFVTNSDGSRLMHADHHGALYASRMMGDTLDASRIADVMRAGSLRVTSSDVFYYYVQDTLYVSDNGKESVAVPQQPAAVYTDVHTAFFFVAEPAQDGAGVTYTVYT
ncbi:MAG: hypothetical protein J6U87_04370, partial [Clostridia bacterium]|nr:hypothetical protein [Clostridia bacterium]